MVFQSKLLTITRKTLYFNNERYGFRRHRYCQRDNRSYKSIFRNFETNLRRKEIRDIKKKAELEKRTERKDRRYKLLYDEIFAPLYENIVIVDEFDDAKIKGLVFTGKRIYDSNHHQEGLEHLRIWNADFLKRFTEIENKINAYNFDIHNFQTKEIDENVSNYLTEKGIETIKDDKAAANGVIIPKLTAQLKSHWFEENKLHCISLEDKKLTINGEIIALFSTDEEKEMIKCHIENLKNLIYIRNKIDDFKSELKKIILEGEQLSKEIGLGINRYIENGEYDTTCSYCENYIKND